MGDTISEDYLRTHCKTGDLLLYHTTRWYSKIIEWFTGSNYSHVAMILRKPTWLRPDLDDIYIVESGAESVRDVLSGEYVYGVQIAPLSHILDTYRNPANGSLYYVSVEIDSIPGESDSITNRLRSVLLDVDGDRYDINVYDWIRAGFHIRLGECHRTNTFWCSALVSYLYVKLGWLTEDTPWSLITPRQFSMLESHSLCFTSGVSLKTEQKICLEVVNERENPGGDNPGGKSG